MRGMPGGRRICGVGARTRGWLWEVDGLAGVTDGLASPLRALGVTDGSGPQSTEPSSEPESSKEGEGLTRTDTPGPFGFAGAVFETRANVPQPLAFFCAGG